MFQITFDGRLASTPELKCSEKGVFYTTLRVLQNERYRNGKGEWVDGPTSSIDVVCFRKLAENVAELKKGDPVIVYSNSAPKGSANGQYVNVVVTASDVAVSSRFYPAASQRPERKPTGDQVQTPEREVYDAEAYAELQAEREAANV